MRREHILSLRTDWQAAFDTATGDMLESYDFTLTLSDQGLLKITVTTDGSTPADLTGLVVRFGLRALVDQLPGVVPLSDLLVYSAGDSMVDVAGDWPAAVRSSGQVAIRYDGFNTTFAAIFAACGKTELHGLAELEVEAADGSTWNTLAQWPVTLKYDVIGQTPTDPAAATRYVSYDTFETQMAGKQSTSEKGQADGYAGLDGDGKVPAAQLPDALDDVLEFADLASFPATGEAGKLYVALDTNIVYRWTGSVYVNVGAVPLTPAEIKALYESNADTNAFTDAEKTKLGQLEMDGWAIWEGSSPIVDGGKYIYVAPIGAEQVTLPDGLSSGVTILNLSHLTQTFNGPSSGSLPLEHGSIVELLTVSGFLAQSGPVEKLAIPDAVQSALDTKLNLSGGTLTGQLNTRNLHPDSNGSRLLGLGGIVEWASSAIRLMYTNSIRALSSSGISFVNSLGATMGVLNGGGDLSLSGNVTANNLSGTNTGDQDLSVVVPGYLGPVYLASAASIGYNVSNGHSAMLPDLAHDATVDITNLADGHSCVIQGDISVFGSTLAITMSDVGGATILGDLSGVPFVEAGDRFYIEVMRDGTSVSVFATYLEV